ncbi:(d)CMP kinase [Sodalis sp. CWE]|uniref:(d)CMP kinase n=1 Tax=Sodalis sp. CWE TaxID=2803816 RepID=UPI001C7CBFAA|nr:(d)CMP kinase [Sodalis sp. CWE]MBX4181138.1 (d)CMP kinase [Sodalis sp. CWE]
MIFITPVVTVDGPSGSGKGTLSKALAAELQWNFLDSGAIYRTLALITIRHQVDITVNNEARIASLAAYLNVHFKNEQGKFSILLEGKKIDKIIYNEAVGNIASKIAVFPRVRKALLQYQKKFRIIPGLIADGRDMGTIVFPDASLKIFLDASLEDRAKRRTQQLQKKGFNVNFNDVLFEIEKRDYRDSKRTIAPLIPAVDAVVLDSTNLTIDEVTKKALEYISQALDLYDEK